MGTSLKQANRDQYLGAAMRVICDLMRAHGVPESAAERYLRGIVKSSYVRRADKTSEAQRISQLADVCTRWHIEPEFVDAHGRAKPLKWNGKTGGLLTLARLVVGPQYARDVADLLVSRRLIRRTANGAWLPKSRVIAPVGFRDAQILRIATMTKRFLRTVIYNSDKQYKGDVLLEVMAQVPRLPRSEIPKFKKFAKAQGLIFAKSVDDWLEARNLRKSKRSPTPTKEAGVVAFAFVD